jgi:Protein of unknown function (DUF3052)
MLDAAGYSSTPLAKKLGLKPGHLVCLLNPPAGFEALLAPLPPGITFHARPTLHTDVAHLFVREQADLCGQLVYLRQQLRADARLWVSWPKQASKVATDVTQNTLREAALLLGFVDIKVCAVDAVWSGLLLVLRKELRG